MSEMAPGWASPVTDRVAACLRGSSLVFQGPKLNRVAHWPALSRASGAPRRLQHRLNPRQPGESQGARALQKHAFRGLVDSFD